tara:strand:- start:3226 stop:4332 length:1107 start_codon:yes stop_codon:yes gene_type:complete
MSVPLFDLKRLIKNQKEEFMSAISKCLDHSYFINGPEVQALERQLGDYTGSKYVIGVSSGTDALVASLMASGLSKGDDVLVTSFTFVASATSILLAGFNPVFVDTAPNSFHPSLEEIKQATTPQTKALIYVHLFGEPNELQEIKRFCDDNNIILYEDCAQSFGSRFDDGSHIGTVGETSCYSFFPAKNLGCFGDGGAIMTDNEETAKKLMMIKNHGSEKQYHNDILGANFRLDTIQASVLSILLRGIDDWIAARKNNADFYYKELSSLDIQLPPNKKYHSWNQYTLRVNDRDSLKKHLDSQGIGNAVYYPIPNHRQKVFSDIISSKDIQKYPNTDTLCREVISLPVYPGLTHQEREAVVKSLVEFYGG